MRDVPAIWDAWRSGALVGEKRPATRVTVQKGWQLQTTASSTVGTWTRGPARWYQDEVHNYALETELPNVVSVNMTRNLESDAGSCDIAITNAFAASLDQHEVPAGQFGEAGVYTWDHGVAQDAQARWGHTPNAWRDVLVPNALLRTYQGFGGHDKTIEQAVTDGNVVLNGVWLIDDVSISTDGTISIKCRDMAKLLIDQQLFPPLVPYNLYPLLYRRWEIRITAIPAEEPEGDVCYTSSYGFGDAEWHSSTDEYYGAFNAGNTGHPAAEAFDMSYESGPIYPGSLAHQRSYWLSEPRGGPNDWTWVEFTLEGGNSKVVNSIYFHPWAGNYYVQVSIFENGEWVAPQTPDGGLTVDGIPYVGTIVTNWEGGQPWGVDTNRRYLPRDYHASRVRLTITNLVKAWEGGYRSGARKIMACYEPPANPYRNLVFAGAAIPVNNENPQRLGYWQVRANGHVYAFGDARAYPPNSPWPTPRSIVVAMTAHPSGQGYWILDVNGRVVSYGQALHHGDLDLVNREDLIDIAPTPSGNGYWLLAKNGEVFAFGDAVWYGTSVHSATMPSGVPALARSIESHPATKGYWVVWSDGFVTAHNLTHLGNGTDRSGFTDTEYVTAIRRTSTGNGYWILSGGGHIQAFGDAPFISHAAASQYPASEWYKFLAWDLIPSSENNAGYAIQHADGNLEPYGDVTSLDWGSIGSGQQRQRFEGNYKDYTDIIRELLLWSGFYLHPETQPPAEMPEVYGNLETTGAYSESDLPADMFDKRPVFDAIKQIRDIVGYIFFIDAEGGARWESPNWWALGNYLIGGTPYSHMPEIDEVVQLTGHNVTRSGSQARSRIIIANSNPMPTIAGQPPATGVISTEIVPRTAADLRGLIVPAMWIEQSFLKKEEQQLMAELIDLRTWMSRRTASVECTANPLIDINDQVRIIERQTGEVYIHYVRGLSINHDLLSGEFKMTLTTHWLGGSPYGVNTLYLAAAARPQGDGYWTATIGGYTSTGGSAAPGVYAHGAAQLFDRHEADSHLDTIIAMRSTPTGAGYYTLDRKGKLLTYGDAVNHGDTQRSTPDVIDMALTPSGAGYWIIERNGTVHTYGDATFYGQPTVSGTMTNGQPVRAEAIESHPSTPGYWVLLSDGTVYAYNLPHHGNADRDRLTAVEYFTNLRRTADGGGYWIVSGGAVVKAFGNAPWRGDGTRYPDTNWVNGLVWELIPGAADGYALLHSDGTLDTFAFAERTAVGAAQTHALWAIVTQEAQAALPDPNVVYGVSPQLMRFLQETGSPGANNAVANGFDTPQEATLKAL